MRSGKGQSNPGQVGSGQPTPAPVRDTASSEIGQPSTPRIKVNTRNHSFVCGNEGCSKAFKRRADLNRHRQTHVTQRKYVCPAQGCDRYGARGFDRKDKLNDHMLAGHDDDTVFICPEPKCGMSLTRDLFSIHCTTYSLQRYDSLKGYRTCPLPRCGFKVYHKRGLQTLETHILNDHEISGRANFARTLKDRGYDFQSSEVVCPMCTTDCRFSSHEEFADHFVDLHYPVLQVCPRHDPYCGKACRDRLDPNYVIPEEVTRHRRAILSLWPDFEECPVFDDIRCRARTLSLVLQQCTSDSMGTLLG